MGLDNLFKLLQGIWRQSKALALLALQLPLRRAVSVKLKKFFTFRVCNDIEGAFNAFMVDISAQFQRADIFYKSHVFSFSVGAAHRAAAFRRATATADRVVEAAGNGQAQQAVEGFEIFAEQQVEAGDRLR